VSQYTHCRVCGEDLLQSPNPKSFGALECCCNDGYCMGCCEGGDLTASQPAQQGDE
jgi:hypothetical protein